MDEETRRISRLLARGKVRGPEADEILERVYEQIDRQKAGEEEEQSAQGARKVRWIRAIGYWGGAALAAAAAVMLIVNVPRGPTETDEAHVPEEGDFGPRPGPEAVLRVSCVPGTLEACPVSSEIVFTITGDVGAGGVLSAYAEPVGRDGERVFFFSKEDGSVELLVASVAGGQAAEGKARLPESLSAGRYRVHAVIADRALDRDELIRATNQPHSVGIRAQVRVDVVRTE